MKIAIIDADLIGRKKHRFPNLVCMKISGYYKEQNNSVVLKTDYNNLSAYDKVFISKVFTDTPIDENILRLPNVEHGGTGFFYDKAPFLPNEIEHHMPDYHLYDTWVQQRIKNGSKPKELTYYTDYSIGFTTRFCFRKCPFCVNQNFTHVERWSPISEFYDPNRKKICLLDDNILGYFGWKDIIEELQSLHKPFQYKQGMDERILTEEKCKVLSNSKYDGDYIFAFDNIADAELIKSKLTMWRKYNSKTTKFYVLCGYDRNNHWDEAFWKQDIIDTFERIKILMSFGCLPYIMRYEKYKESPFKGTYVNLATWCNQPRFFKKKSYREWVMADTIRRNIPYEKFCNWRYMNELERIYPEISKKYYDLKFEELNKYN